MTKLEKIKLTINYYEISFDFLEDFKTNGDQFQEIFQIIITLSKTRAAIRY
jgi:hypothetical protein